MNEVNNNTRWILKESEKIYTVLYTKNDGFTQDWVKLDSLYNGWDLISRHEFLLKFRELKLENTLIDSDGWICLEDAFPNKPGTYTVKVSVGAFKSTFYEDKEELKFDDFGANLGFCKKRTDWHFVSHWKPLQRR